MNMKNAFLPLMVFACMLFTACEKDDIVHPPIELTYDILTPESVEYIGGDLGWAPGIYLKANGLEGEAVISCKNYPALAFAETSLDYYDCGWAIVRIDANKVTIHFPENISDRPQTSEEIIITGQYGKGKAYAIIGLTRTFEKDGQSETKPLPESARFKIVNAGFIPFMNIDSPLSAPLDLITFRITDIKGNYTPVELPEFTQYYDSIVWSADDFPHTFRIYDKYVTAGGTEQRFNSQWSSHFFRCGTVTTHIKGYDRGKVKYETSLNVNLYERDFLGLEWGPIVLQNPQNPTAYCLLDKTFEYQVNDITANGEYPFSKIIPVNHRMLPHSDYMEEAQMAVLKLMETNIGNGQSGEGKERLFKCLPQKNTEAVLYWENRTSRMLMVHQIPGTPDETLQELYYLHIEPKR